MKNEQTVQITVAGLVQGVGFRWATRKAAIQFSLAGFVQNLNNGRVKIIAQGVQSNLKRFCRVIRDSPTPYGHVDRINIKPVPRIPYSQFIVK